MVVVAVKVEAEEEGCGGVRWGTWEELVLGGAVQRHGAASWDAVAAELRSRSPCSFSPEECEAKFSEIQARYSASDAWFEELRKQRVAELRRDMSKSESFIVSLQSVIESLSNSKRDDDNSACHTESRSRNENTADTNSSSKELSKDRSSAASFTEEASNSQKSQNVQNTSAETLSKPHVEKKLCAKDGLLWGSRKKRGLRDKRAILMADDGSRDGENTSTSCIQKEGSSEGCKKGMKIPKLEPGVSVCERAKPSLEDILNSISSQGDCEMLQHQIDIQRKKAKYKKMIRQHMDFRILRTKIKSGVISSTKELLKDMLLFVNNLLAFYPKATLEHLAAIELRGIVCKTLQQSSSILSVGCRATEIATYPAIKKTAGKIASNTVIRKTVAGLATDPVIKKTMAKIASNTLIKKTTAVIASDPVMKKATAGIARDPVMKKATAGIAKGPVIKKEVVEIGSEPVIKKAPAGISSEPVIKKAAAGIVSEPVIKKTAAGVAGAPIVKKIARTMPPVRHVPRDAKRGNVSSRETGSSVSQAEPKVVPRNATLTSNGKPVQENPPAKKRGVGRPPKSGQKRAAEQQDSPSRGRKKTRR